MKIRCVIVDDEPLALDVLEAYIEKIEDLELLARVDNAIEAFNLLNREKVDLLFLDIQMPKLTGIDLLKNISHPPNVIFTTAYRDYALEGYELDVIDYLVKPISFQRFCKAIDKATELIQYNGKEEPSTPSTQTAPVATSTNEYFFVKTNRKIVKVKYDELL